MNKEELFENLEATRIQLLQALEPLPDEAFHEAAVMDDWTVADILNHLMAWESELVTALQRIKQGKEPVRMLAALKDIDGYNERRFEENKGRQVDRILSDFHALRLQLEEWLGEFSDRDLNDPDRYKWSDGHPLWKLVEGNSFGHELQHLADIERFSNQRLSSNR